MKKIIKILTLCILILGLVTGYQLFHYDNRYFLKDSIYVDYNPETKYQNSYPVENYVDERMDAFAILRGGMIGSMARYDDFVNTDGIFDRISIMFDVFKDRSIFIKFTQQHQYQETTPVRLEYVGENYDHNFKYYGVLEDGTEVSGNLAIWGDSNAVSTAISFQDGNGNIDRNKAALFTDDSNAEMMAYLMIQEIQAYLGTSYEPNEAALKFFNCSIETMAGSISYHAATSLASLDYDMGDLTVDKVKTANISTIDEDGFLVNQSY